MGLAPPPAAVAVVEAPPAVELVGLRTAVEAVAAGAAVAAVLARSHDADVAAAAAPAAVAAVAVAAVVVAGAADAVAVAVAGDADVVVGSADAAVAAGAAGEAEVPLGVADELVGSGAEVDAQREGHLLGDADEVAARAHLEFDRVDAAGAADGPAALAGEVAAARALAGHVALDDDHAAVALLAQGQLRARVGAVDDDLASWRGGVRDRQDNEGDHRERAGQQLAAGGGKHRGHTKHVHRLTKPKLET